MDEVVLRAAVVRQGVSAEAAPLEHAAQLARIEQAFEPVAPHRLTRAVAALVARRGRGPGLAKIRADLTHDALGIVATRGGGQFHDLRLGHVRERFAQHALAPRNHGLGDLVAAQLAGGAHLEALPEFFGLLADARIRAIVAVRDHDEAARPQHARALVEEALHVVVVRDRLDRQHHVGTCGCDRQRTHVGSHRMHAVAQCAEVRIEHLAVRFDHGRVHLGGPHAAGAPAGDQVRDHAESRAGVDDHAVARAADECEQLHFGAHPRLVTAVVEQVAVRAVEPRVHAGGRAGERGASRGLELTG